MNDLNLEVVRFNFTPLSTIGKLYVNGVFECYTLEDCVRDKKIYGMTAIPTGTYKVILNLSNRFKRVLPLLIDVSNFEGVRIHPGNYAGNENFHSEQKIDVAKTVLHCEEYLEVFDDS